MIVTWLDGRVSELSEFCQDNIQICRAIMKNKDILRRGRIVGLVRSLGKRVWREPSWVRIPPSPLLIVYPSINALLHCIYIGKIGNSIFSFSTCYCWLRAD